MEATLPDRWALASGRASAKGCVICRGPRLSGARLCAPCKAALKRARLETVSELVPRPSRAAAEERARRRRKNPVAATPARAHQRWWIVPALFLLVVAAGAVGDLALHAARRTEVPLLASPVVAPAPQVEPAAVALKSAQPIVEAPAPQSAPPAAVTPHPVRVAPKRIAPPVTNAAPADRFAAATPAAASPVSTPEIVSPVREAPAPDRWQVMADQIARCGRDGFLAGVICEQRVRLKYCEGYWGQVAQCPSSIANDHGQ